MMAPGPLAETAPEPRAEAASEIALAFEPTDACTVVVRLGTMLDYRNAERFKAASQAMVQAGARRFILDASHVGVLDSTGLGALFSLQRLLGPKEGTVALAAPSYPVQTLVSMMRLHRIFPQYRSVEQAHEGLRQKAYGDRLEDAPERLEDDPDSLEGDLDFSLEGDLDFSLEDGLDSRDEDLEVGLEDGPWDFFEEASWPESPPPPL